MGVKKAAPSSGVFLVLLSFLVGCGESSDPGARSTRAPITSATPEMKPKNKPPPNPCADYPPPFRATYLPEGFEKKLHKGAGLFKGADGAGSDYPTEGLLGYYPGPVEVLHVNFETRPGPLPYEPGAPRRLRVLGRRGAIGTIEGGWSVEFVLGNCEFRMDTYGISRAETVKIAKGLREKA